MSTRAQDLLCKALEIAEKSAEMYAKAIEACEEGPGREVFQRLHEDEKYHMERIKEIHESLVAGEAWADACPMPEEEETESVKTFRDIAKKYGTSKACTSELGAVNTGLDVAKASVDFFEDWLKQAENPTEKEFVERMVQEERGNYMLLSDLQYYYEDPQGWALKEDHQLLDGA